MLIILKIFIEYFCYHCCMTENFLGINPDACRSIMSDFEQKKFYHLDITLYNIYVASLTKYLTI